MVPNLARVGVRAVLLAGLLALGAACTEDLLGAPPEDLGQDRGQDLGGDVGADLPPVTGVIVPRFELAGTEFLRLPWPSDYRVDGRGAPVLNDFPNSTGGLLGSYVRTITSEVRGFSTMPVVYVGLDRGPGAEAHPVPAATMVPSAAVQLLDVGAGTCGQRVPIEVRFEAVGDEYRADNTLMAAPVPGFALEPARPYALVVLRSFGLQSGLRTERPAELEGVLEGTHPDAALVAAYAPLVDCLDTAGLQVDDIAVATVFTTQDPTEELRRVRAFAVDPASTPAPAVSGWRLDAEHSRESRYRTYTGTFSAPIFQRGQTPYAVVGGGFRFGDDGEPLVQRWEDVPFVVTWPTSSQPPFDVLIWSDGTGASLTHHLGDEPVRNALSAGFAVAAFQPQFHGTRSGNVNTELSTFNFGNAEAFRTNFRQQVIDTAYFVRLVRETLPGLAAVPALETDVLVYGGHSQGAIVGALVAGVETGLSAYVLNGVGAYLSITVVEREDPFDFNQQIRSFLGIPGVLDRFHPVIALIQLGGDVADPINYARYWRGFAGHRQGASLYLINGQLDDLTPQTSVNAMTIAAGALPVRDRGWNVDPFGVWELVPAALPITANTSALDGSPLTIATLLSATTGHFTIYDLREARDLALGFWQTALGGTPVLGQ
jgi:hypothetical protein